MTTTIIRIDDFDDYDDFDCHNGYDVCFDNDGDPIRNTLPTNV